ncbi:MAG: ABC transporter permease [Clostridia bacterium]|nr:ABC transporter permease [Clostridia bacterium]
MNVKVTDLVRMEIAKMRRSQILLVGIIALALCPALQYGTHQITAAQEPFAMADLFRSVIWGNVQMFLPISFVMIGGFVISRETSDDTLKSLLTVPVSYPMLLTGKLMAVGLLSVAFGLYSCAVTLVTGCAAGLEWGSAAELAGSCAQNIAVSVITYGVTMPLIVLFGGRPGAYLGGSIAAFFCGYSILFFKNGVLRSVYPFLAAFALVGFDTAEFNGAKVNADIGFSMLSMAVVWIAAVLLVVSARPPERRQRRSARIGTGRARS